jgi:hypothetical protein
LMRCMCQCQSVILCIWQRIFVPDFSNMVSWYQRRMACDQSISIWRRQSWVWCHPSMTFRNSVGWGIFIPLRSSACKISCYFCEMEWSLTQQPCFGWPSSWRLSDLRKLHAMHE